MMEAEQLTGKEPKGYRILHTADWHLGKVLYEKSCQEEHGRFLKWLVETVRKTQADALVVSGDIFDHKAVSNASRKDYVELIDSLCDLQGVEIFLLAGNHDSADFLDVDRDLYAKRLNIHVLGHPQEAEQSHFTLTGRNGAWGVKLVAIPFVDKRLSLEYREDDELTSDERYGIVLKEYFRQAVECAKQDNPAGYPLVMAAHLAVGRQKAYKAGDYVGNLQQLSSELFPSELSYVALGHIHQPYFVDEDGGKHIRYSGSIMPMSIDDKSGVKSVTLLEFRNDGHHAYEEIPIEPALLNVFQLSGSAEEMLERARQLAGEAKVRTLCQFSYVAPQKILDFDEQLRAIVRCNEKIELTGVCYIGKGEGGADGEHSQAESLPARLDVEHPEELVKQLLEGAGVDENLRTEMIRVLVEHILPEAMEEQSEQLKDEEDKRALTRKNQTAMLVEQRQRDKRQKEQELGNIRRDLDSSQKKLAKAEKKEKELREKAARQRERKDDEAYAQWCQANKVEETAKAVTRYRQDVERLQSDMEKCEAELSAYADLP